MDLELNLAPMYAANLTVEAWGLMGWCLKQLDEKGYIAGVEDGPVLDELLKAGLVKRFGKNLKVSPEVARPI